MTRVDALEYIEEWDAESDEVEPERLYKPRRTQREILAELVEEGGDEGSTNFITTYRPSRHEAGWLLDSLQTFYLQNLLVDVQASVKGGKEASVYRCAAHPNIPTEFLAAKVYRPRKLRNLRNDAMYREGRPILTADGRAVKKSDHRILRAIGKKTDFGVQSAHISWLMYEYTTLENLYNAGAAVPKPYAAGDNAILMEYLGDKDRPASTLIETEIDRDEAEPLFHEVLRNIRLLFEMGFVHGDLSAYNILYWQGKVTLIDFPQVTNWEGNPNAELILRRDIQRIAEYFARFGIVADTESILAEFIPRITQSSTLERS